jgi:hypothetical protein
MELMTASLAETALPADVTAYLRLFFDQVATFLLNRAD